MTNARQTAINFVSHYTLVAMSLQDFISDIQYCLDANTHKPSIGWMNYINAKYQIPFKKNTFSTPENIRATIRRTYRQLETSKNPLYKTYAKHLRYAYEHPLYYGKKGKLIWNVMLTDIYEPPALSLVEKVLNAPTNFAHIGYYYKCEMNANVLMTQLQKIYKTCCDIVLSLAQYYKIKKFLNEHLTQQANAPLVIKILFCFSTPYEPEHYYVVNYHRFNDFSEFLKEINNLNIYSHQHKKANEEQYEDESDDATQVKTDDLMLDEMELKWIRITSIMTSSNKFSERTGEIGYRYANYIEYI